MKEGFQQLHTELEQTVSPEKMAVIEKARNERLAIISESFGRLMSELDTVFQKIPKPIRAVGSIAVNFTFLASYKLSVEAWKGKTADGKELSSSDRVLRVIIAATDIIGKGLYFYGKLENNPDIKLAGKISYGTSWPVWLYTTSKEILVALKSAGEYISNVPRVQKLMEQVRNFKQPNENE